MVSTIISNAVHIQISINNVVKIQSTTNVIRKIFQKDPKNFVNNDAVRGSIFKIQS